MFTRSHWAVVSVLAASACTTGSIGDERVGPPPTSTTTDACSVARPGPSPMRRLTAIEYDNTVADLLGDTTHPAKSFDVDVGVGFDGDVGSRALTEAMVGQYMDAAAALSAAADLAKLAPCAGGKDAATCARDFIGAFGARAYRRPIAGDETTSLMKTYDRAIADGGDYAEGLRRVVERMLQSPHFLYRVELGDPSDAPGPDAVALTPWELATRLSYYLWQTMPDDALFEAAGSGHLKTKKDVEAQTDRMLKDPRARSTIADFHRQWLGLDAIGDAQKNAALYPSFTPAMKAAMRESVDEFLDYVVWDDDKGDLGTLLTANYGFVNTTLAPVFGLTNVSSTSLVKVDLNPTMRSGFLTSPGFLAAVSKASSSAPIRRGVYVLERMLCVALPPPPVNVDNSDPPMVDGQTTRQAFETKTSGASCKGCHAQINPVGYAFEHYDAIGAWRAVDQGAPIDSTGEILAQDSQDAAGPFKDAIELTQHLARSEDVRACEVVELFHFAHGRAATPDDACAIATLKDGFGQGARIADLVARVTQTDAFFYRRPVVAGK